MIIINALLFFIVRILYTFEPKKPLLPPVVFIQDFFVLTCVHSEFCLFVLRYILTFITF